MFTSSIRGPGGPTILISNPFYFTGTGLFRMTEEDEMLQALADEAMSPIAPKSHYELNVQQHDEEAFPSLVKSKSNPEFNNKKGRY
jgi:hypothetical protein